MLNLPTIFATLDYNLNQLFLFLYSVLVVNLSNDQTHVVFFNLYHCDVQVSISVRILRTTNIKHYFITIIIKVRKGS